MSIKPNFDYKDLSTPMMKGEYLNEVGEIQPDWTQVWTPDEAEKQLQGFKWLGPGWYLTESETMMVVPCSHSAPGKYRFMVYDHRTPINGLHQMVNSPVRLDTRGEPGILFITSSRTQIEGRQCIGVYANSEEEAGEFLEVLQALKSGEVCLKNMVDMSLPSLDWDRFEPSSLEDEAWRPGDEKDQYKCTDCNFETQSGINSVDHEARTGHDVEMIRGEELEVEVQLKDSSDGVDPQWLERIKTSLLRVGQVSRVQMRGDQIIKGYGLVTAAREVGWSTVDAQDIETGHSFILDLNKGPIKAPEPRPFTDTDLQRQIRDEEDRRLPRGDFNLVLISVGPMKIPLIKVLRQEIPGIGLREAKELTELSLPATILKNISRGKARAIKKFMEGVGAQAKVEKSEK